MNQSHCEVEALMSITCKQWHQKFNNTKLGQRDLAPFLSSPTFLEHIVGVISPM